MTDSKNSEGIFSAAKTSTGDSAQKTPWMVLTLPLVMVGLILFFSPNFQPQVGMRSAPLGGDFLQEWVGAKVFGLHEEGKLYDLEYVRGLQHDASLVGFSWPEEDYFPMVYPPFYYASLQPLSRFSYPVAANLWAVCSALAMSISGFLLFQFYPPCRRIFKVGFVAAMIFVPLLTCFNMGQKSTFLLLILSGTFVLLHNKRPFSAGVVFGLIVFKPHLGVVIGLTMLFKRQWKFALGALLVVGLVFSYCWLNDPQLVRDYLKVVSKMGSYVQTGGYLLADSHSLWGASQLTFSWLPAWGVKTMTAVLSLAIVFLLWRAVQGKFETESPRFAQLFSAMIIAMVMLSPHFYSYDLTILLLPMLLIVSSYPPGKWRATVADGSLGMVLLTIFVLAGLFPQIAGVIKIQPSVILLVAALFLIGLTRSGSDERHQGIVE